MKKIYVLSLLFLLALTNCNKTSPDANTDTPATENPTINFTYLTDDIEVKTLTLPSLQLLANTFLSTPDLPSLYSVSGNKITYKTTFKGESITASGIVLVPQTETSLGVVSLQHGTITQLEHTPSDMKISSNEVTLGAILASMGYIVVMPDYIGYGESESLPHPYELEAGLGLPNLDMLAAAFEFFEKKDITTTEQLFVIGYSEGAYASMALLKALKTSTKFDVTHAFLGGGAYNKTASMKTILQETESLSYLRFYLWVLHTYNSYYDNLKHPWEYYVKPEFATQLNQINDWKTVILPFDFPNTIEALFTPTFINQAIEEDETTAIQAAFGNNDLYDWHSVVPITLYHGTEDEFVPPLNSSTAYLAMQQRGSTVKYVPLEGKNHQTAIQPFIKEVIKALKELN